MNDQFHIGEILKDGFRTVEDVPKRYFVLVIVPLVLGALLVYLFNVTISPENFGSFISSLSIFAGFFFTLIVYVSDKAANKKRELNKSNIDDEQTFFKIYMKFTNSLIIQISYSILWALILIGVFFLTQYNFEGALPTVISRFEKPIATFFDFIAVSSTLHFLIFLLLIVSNMYAMFLQELRN